MRIKKSTELKNCRTICEATKKSASSLFDIFSELKKKKGSPTDQQQDLLRAIIILISAGFDSFLKQLVDDSLGMVRNKSKTSHKYFINKTKELLASEENKINLELMSEILMSGNSEKALSDRIIRNISGHSLQNYGELQEVLRSFGLSDALFEEKRVVIKNFFKARNCLCTRQ